MVPLRRTPLKLMAFLSLRSILSLLSQQFFHDWAGYFGVALYIGSYVALQLGWIPGVGYRYAALNLAAATFVLISLIGAFNMASALIQLSWIVISVVGMVRTYIITRRLFFNEEEEHLLHHGLHGTPRLIARRIFDSGNWVDAETGVRLITEGEPVHELYYIMSGRADVLVDEQVVAEVTEGFVGEMNAMQSGPASATVEITEPARLFCISGESLRRLSQGNAEIKIYLESHLAASTKAKLMHANTRLTRTA